MLREDGMVMDDGTTARFGENHYVLTTTGGAAAEVMRHLEFCLQVLWPDLDAQIFSVTDQWEQYSIAGPKARELVNSICEGEITNENFPYMSCGETRIGSVIARLFRISFSGEQGYEIVVPARYGDSLARELTKQAAALGGGWYGLEALNVLRIEKGLLTHAEITGRVTASDLGLGKMVSSKK